MPELGGMKSLYGTGDLEIHLFLGGRPLCIIPAP